MQVISFTTSTKPEAAGAPVPTVAAVFTSGFERWEILWEHLKAQKTDETEAGPYWLSLEWQAGRPGRCRQSKTWPQSQSSLGRYSQSVVPTVQEGEMRLYALGCPSSEDRCQELKGRKVVNQRIGWHFAMLAALGALQLLCFLFLASW